MPHYSCVVCGVCHEGSVAVEIVVASRPGKATIEPEERIEILVREIQSHPYDYKRNQAIQDRIDELRALIAPDAIEAVEQPRPSVPMTRKERRALSRVD